MPLVAAVSMSGKSPTHSPNRADTRLSRFLGSGRITGNPHLTRHWPFGRVTKGLPTTWKLLRRGLCWRQEAERRSCKIGPKCANDGRASWEQQECRLPRTASYLATLHATIRQVYDQT